MTGEVPLFRDLALLKGTKTTSELIIRTQILLILASNHGDQ